MDYRLLYDAGNGYEDLDLGDEVPAMNYQIANLNELKDRHASYSQAIKLPKTAKNMRMLGFIDSFAVVADAAYTPRRCKLLCEGAQLSLLGAVLYVDGIDDNAGGSIGCQIVSDTADLFSRLGDVDNEQMGNILWQNLWTSARIVRDNAEASGVRRWPALFTQQGQSPANPFPFSQVEVYHLVPCYRFATMIEQLFLMFGYRIESDILDDPYMKSLYITASKITEDCDVSADYIGKRTSVPYPAANTGIFYQSVELDHVIQVETLGGPKKVPNENSSGPQWNEWRYYAAMPGDYKLEITIKNVGSQPLDKKRRVRVLASATRGVEYNSAGKTQFLLDESINNDVAPGKEWKLESEVPGLNAGDYIGWEILIYSNKLTNVSEYTHIDVTARVTLVHEVAIPGVGSRFDYARATGFNSYKELAQTFMQLFGVLVDVEQAPKVSQEGIIGTIRMHTFEELYRRRDAGKYVDWSAKLVIDNERNVGFSLSNYAQRNYIQLTDNTDDGTHDAGSFSVSNRTLQSEKTLFTIAAEAGRNLTWIEGVADPNVTYVKRTVAVVPTLDPMIEPDEEGQKTMTPTYKGCKTHLVRIDESTVFNLQIKTGWHDYGWNTYTPFPQALTVSMQELIDRYYTPVKKLMANARTITASFNLTALDIAQLDLFTPVWLKPYGCYFYISKINNFIAGQPTKVELVKMSDNESPLKYYIHLNGSDQDVYMTIPEAGGTYRIAYSTNGTLQTSVSGVFTGTLTVANGFIVLQMDGNQSSETLVSNITVSVTEAPNVMRKIIVTQEGLFAPTKEVNISLETNGTDLYIQISRPLKEDEGVVVMTRGAGRMGWYDQQTSRRLYFKSKKRWHIPHLKYEVASDGKIKIPRGGEGYTNDFRWKLESRPKGTFVHIHKANWSKGFGYKAVEGLNKAVTFAVVVVRDEQPWRPEEISNRCYFESRCHIRNGELTQEFVVTQ